MENKNGKFFDSVLNSRTSKIVLSVYAGLTTITCLALQGSLNQNNYYSEYKEQKQIAEQLSGENENLNTTVTDLQNQLSELESANEQLSQINENQTETINKYQSQETTDVKEDVEEQKVETEQVVEQQKEETQTVQSSSPTLAQKNAVKQAENYLRVMAFSRTGLISQLEYEGYSTEDATYAVDNIKVDWNEQCAKKAENYLEVMSFSRDGLYSQLEYEGFTHEQIEYGLQAVGY
ncbi:Ltp family lipoprotein [Turicibacter sanguinis]|uniref:Ltp family lipoprotein n=1 Tax=Turicibacter sanguinis TaxID=154288 RepID=UPI00325BCA95